MPIEIELPDGSIAEFPDGMADAEIERVLSQQFGGQSRPDFSNVQSSVTSEAAAPSAVDGMSGAERFAAGIGRSIVETGRGIRQAVPAAVMGVGRALAGDPAARALLDKRTEGFRQQEQARVDEARRLDGPLLDTGAGMAGNITGLVGQLVGPGLVARGTAAASALLPSTIRGNALQGTALGSLQSVSTDESRAQNALIGGAAGGAGAALASGVGRAGRAAVNAWANRGVSSTDRIAAGIIAREADDVSRVGVAQPSAVPGVQRTLAEESLDPGIARLERNLRSTERGFDAVDRSNNAARVAAVETFAGDEAALSAARSARQQAAMPLLGQAYLDKGIDTAPIRSQIEQQMRATASRPSVQSALGDVQRAFDNAGDDVFSLYNVRKYIGDLLTGKAGADKSYARAASKELVALRETLDEQLAGRSPSFANYLQVYRDMSAPINRMQVGQALISRSSGGAVLDPVTGAQVLTPAQFSKASRSLDEVAAKATGFKNAKADAILQPTDIATIKAIQDDLERQAFRASAGSGGNSQTFERSALQQRMARRASDAVTGMVPGGRYAQDFLEVLDRNRNDRVKERLAYLVANPEEARRVLAALPPKGQEIVSKALAQAGGALSRAGALGVMSLDEPPNPGP